MFELFPFALGQKVECCRFPMTKSISCTAKIVLKDILTVCCLHKWDGVWWLRFRETGDNFYLADRFIAISKK